MVSLTEKPWGHEELLFEKDGLGMKRLVIKPKHKTSFHYHAQKNEIFYVESGKASIRFTSGKKELKKGEFIYIPKKIVHQTYNSGPEKLSIIEFGNPQSNADVIRVEDPYAKKRAIVEKTFSFASAEKGKPGAFQKAVFLDRDGVINENRVDYVKNWGEFVFKPKAKAAIRQLNNAGYLVIVVSNQSCISKGIVPENAVNEINRRMEDELNQAGGRIDAIYFCPHTKEENCNCRKPKTGMIDFAVKAHNIDLSQSWFIGDSIKYDVPLGKAVRVKTILINEGHKISIDEITQAVPDYVVDNLMEAVQLIKGSIFASARQS